MESYDLFIEKGVSMLEEGGYLAYVLPEAILSVNSHQQAREHRLFLIAHELQQAGGRARNADQQPLRHHKGGEDQHPTL